MSGCALLAATIMMSGVAARSLKSERPILCSDNNENVVCEVDPEEMNAEVKGVEKTTMCFDTEAKHEMAEEEIVLSAEEVADYPMFAMTTRFYSEEDAEKAQKIVDEETIIIDHKEGFKIGCYVAVNGRGNEASDGSGNFGYDWAKQKMMIVGIRENSEYPYACAIVNENPNVNDVMAWFKEDNLKYYVSERQLVKDSIKEVYEQGGHTVTRYSSPEGFYLDDKNPKRSLRNVTQCPVYSDDSKEVISNNYSISLEK